MAIKTISKRNIEIVSITDSAIDIDKMMGGLVPPVIKSFTDGLDKIEDTEQKIKATEEAFLKYNDALKKYDEDLGKTKWSAYRMTYNPEHLILKEGERPTKFIYHLMTGEKKMELDDMQDDIEKIEKSIEKTSDVRAEFSGHEFVTKKWQDFHRSVVKSSMTEVKDMQSDDGSYYDRELKSKADFEWLFTELPGEIIKELSNAIYFSNTYSEEDKKKLESLLLSNTQEK